MDSIPTGNPVPSGDAHARLHEAFTRLRDDLSQTIVGQAALVERLLIALLADGHLLVEGAPGLAKTTAIRALASRLQADFARVQFTPDLLPADLTGTEVWRPQEGRFEFQAGPIFHPLLLADEINRARVAGRPRLRHSGRHPRHRAGRAPPPRAAQLRSHRRRLGWRQAGGRLA